MSPVTNSSSASLTSSPPPSLSSSLPSLLNVSLASAGGQNDTDDERNEGLAVIEVAISGTILFLAVAGNSIVVVSLMLKRGKLSRMHLMMLHLSLADLSVAFFQVLPQMVWDITFRFQGGAFLCGAVKYLQLVTMYASSYVLVSTAVDRHVAICKPFLSQKWTSTHAHLLVMVAWLASLAFSLPQIFIFSLSEVDEGSGVYDCWASFNPPWTLQVYIAWNALSVFFAPSLALAVLYGHISYAVWKSSKMAGNWAHRYTPVSKGPKSTAGTRQHTDRVTHPQSVSVCHSTVPTTTTYDASTHSCHHQDGVHPGTPRDPESKQSYAATKPWNERNGSQTVPLHRTKLTQTSDTSNSGRLQTQEKFHLCSSLSEDVPPSARLLTNKTGAGDTLRKERPSDDQGNRRSTHVQRSESLRRATILKTHSPDYPKLRILRDGQVNNSSSTDPHRTGGSRHTPAAGSSRGVKCKGSAKDVHGGQPGCARGPSGGVGISRAKMKTIKLTLTVVICYLVCWTPFYVAQLWAAYDTNASYDSIFFTLVLLLASVNSCTNPWIYMVFSDTICNTVRAIADRLSCSRSASASPSSRNSGHNGTRVLGGRHYKHSHHATYHSSDLSSAATSTARDSSHTQFNGVSKI